MSFYNKYRPKTFDELNSAKVRTLVTSFLSKKKEELPHAFLFTGPKGIGKTTTARLLAKYFNCLQPQKTGEPCGQCDLCIRIANGNALDVLEMDAASNTGVDNIRDLKDKIMLAPSQAQWKVYIIDEVHMLSTGAFNALLKTLEEPPAKTIFILATTDPQKVPDTIQSRCLVLPFQKPEIDEVVKALEAIISEEKLSADSEALRLLAEAADGSYRDATKLLEQLSLSTKKITLTDVQQMLSLPENKEVSEFITQLQQKNASLLLQQIERLSKDGKDIRNFFVSAIRSLQSYLVAQIIDGKQSNWTSEELQQALTVFTDGYGKLKTTGLPDIALELAVLSYCSNVPSLPVKKFVNISTQMPIKTVSSTPPEETSPQKEPAPIQKEKENTQVISEPPAVPITMLLTLEKLREHWNDFIAEVRNKNHSISGVLRSTRPKSVANGIVTIEAFYPFHKDKLSETKTKDDLMKALKTLFGEKVNIEVVLGKK